MTFKITKEWIDNNKTVNGGYTSRQAKALGLNWPLVKGWKKSLVGANITLIQKIEFEVLRTAKPNNKQVKSVLTIDSCIAYLFKNMDKIDNNDRIRIKTLLTRVTK